MTSFRIARERSLYQSFDARAVQARQAELARLREQSGGLRVNRPSDDPAAFGQARRMEQMVGRYDTYLRTISSSRDWINHTERALGQLVEVFVQVSEEGVRAANDTISTTDRELIASRLESLLGEAVDSLNARHGNEYLFAGNRTGTAPFDADGNPTGDATELGGTRKRDIGPGSEIDINISGTRLNNDPSGHGIAGTLRNLVDAVRAGDQALMQSALEDVTSVRDHVSSLVTDTGNTARRLTLAEDNLREANLLAESRRSEIEDIDLLENLLAIQRAETSLQAALQVTARTIQHSILDFLR